MTTTTIIIITDQEVEICELTVFNDDSINMCICMQYMINKCPDRTGSVTPYSYDKPTDERADRLRGKLHFNQVEVELPVLLRKTNRPTIQQTEMGVLNSNLVTYMPCYSKYEYEKNL